MSIQLTAVSPRLSVGAADDPFKKYWWVILVMFALTAAWLFLPILDAPVGSAHVDPSKAGPNPNAEQSLDAVEAANGAGGAAIDLSMDGSKKHKDKSEESFESMLYQPPPEAGAAAPGAPLGASANLTTLAQQLKDVGAAGAVKSKDAAGWNEKAQAGFASPHLGGSGLSGAGSAGGGGAGASAGVSAFGASAAQVSMGSTRGLKEDDGEKAAAGGMAALRGAAKAATAAAASKSNDTARAGVGSFFDGSKGRNSAIGGGPDIAGASYAALDAAPANLKLNDPKLNEKKLDAPPATPAPSAAPDATKQMMMMMATMVIGGMVGGPAGQMIMMAGPMLMMQQQQQAASAAAAKSATGSQAAANRINSNTP